MNLRDLISQVIKADRANRAAQKANPAASKNPRVKTTKAIKATLISPTVSTHGSKSKRIIPAVKSFRNLWDVVASGKHFDYGPFHERSYLQGLQNIETVRFMARHLAKHLGSRVMVASGFIDGTPRFTWTSPRSGKTVTGEIGDILAVFEVHDGKGGVEHFASFLQAKMSDLANDVRTGTSGAKSTQKELDLYARWPPVTFENSTRSYALNPTSQGQAPFKFSRFLTVSDPQDRLKGVPVPKWTVNNQAAPDSPMAIFDTPRGTPDALLKWLENCLKPYTHQVEPVDISNPKADFDHLVVDILGNLVRRQRNARVGYSGGILIQHAYSALLMSDSSRAVTSRFVYCEGAPEFENCQQIPSTGLDIGRPNVVDASSEDEILVLYIVKGPEGVNRDGGRDLKAPNSIYPGAGLLG